jgi:DNA polymerase
MYHRITLAHPTDWDGFRRQARRLLQYDVPPGLLQWQEQPAGSTGEQGELFATAISEPAAPYRLSDPSGASASTEQTTVRRPDGRPLFSPDGPSRPTPTIPAAFLETCQRLLLHRDPARLDLIYRLLWRLQREPQLRADPLDPDVAQANRMLRAVNRDIHHLHGFVRFRPVRDWPGVANTATTNTNSDDCWHVAWCEPQHRTLAAAAPYFTRRMASLPWAILSPDGSAIWDTHHLYLLPPEDDTHASLPPADAGETLWLTYYASTFNPTRLKLAAMRRAMPAHYWKNLPEAALIEPLAASAGQRLESMV